jgi:hypothetical protein
MKQICHLCGALWLLSSDFSHIQFLAIIQPIFHLHPLCHSQILSCNQNLTDQISFQTKQKQKNFHTKDQIPLTQNIINYETLNYGVIQFKDIRISTTRQMKTEQA